MNSKTNGHQLSQSDDEFKQSLKKETDKNGYVVIEMKKPEYEKIDKRERKRLFRR
jgi:hypothetical protein